MPRATLSQVSICNMALSHLSIGKVIASITEKSAEARACSAFYDQAKDEVLRDFAWPFATRTVTLALVAPQPTPEWAYSYRYPSDCLAARRLLNGSQSASPFPAGFSAPTTAPAPMGRVMTAQSRIPFRIQSDDAGLLIYTDIAPSAPIAATASALAQPGLPQLEYTIEADDPTRYPSDFSQAVAFLLASYIAPRVTGGDKFKLGQRALQLYQWAMPRASANAGNEEQADQLPDSEAIRARG